MNVLPLHKNPVNHLCKKLILDRKLKTYRTCKCMAMKHTEFCFMHNKPPSEVGIEAGAGVETDSSDNLSWLDWTDDSEKKKPKLIIKKKHDDDLDIPIGIASSPISLLSVSPAILTLENLNQPNINYRDLIFTMKHYKIDINGTKAQLVNILKCYLSGRKLLTRQAAEQIIFNAITRYHIKIIGKHQYLDRCVNADDFYSSAPVKRIPKVYLYCHCDEDGYCYGFDIRSLHMYYTKTINDRKNVSSVKNPYNNKPFSNITKTDVIRHINFIGHLNYEISYPEEEYDAETKYRNYVTSTFQKIDQLGFKIDQEWFTELSCAQLKKLYEILEDVWNYRLELTFTDKIKIVANGTLFTQKVHVLISNNQQYIQEKILADLNRMITEGHTIEDCRNGALYFLLGFVQVSEAAASALPHLMFALEG